MNLQLSRILLAILSVFAAPVVAICQNQIDVSGSLNSDFYLSDTKIKDYEQSAMGGDGHAARILSLHYGLVKMSMEKEFYWATIGAENNDPVSEYSLGVYYARRAGNENRLRAIFWLKKARASGAGACRSGAYDLCSPLLHRLEKSPENFQGLR